MDLVGWIEALPFAGWLSRSVTAYLIVNAAHILGVGLLVGAILPLDLRVLGLFRSVPLAIIGPFLSRISATGLGVAIVTGFLLFSVRPAEYLENPAFLIKLALLSFAVINLAVLHVGGGWKRMMDQDAPNIIGRVAAALSFSLWSGALLAGRWIGFV